MKMPSYLRPNPGVVLIAGLGGFFSVVNLGYSQNWTQTSAPSEPWRTMACSADGAKIIASGWSYTCPYACYYNTLPIYISTDSGLTWNPSGSPRSVWQSLACSADATTMIAAASGPVGYYYDSAPGQVYFSTDSGRTWMAANLPTNYWSSVACSADGTRLVAAGEGIYTSADSGATWTQTSAPINNWTAVASSADGTKLIAAGGYFFGDSRLYVSTNAGATWTQTTAPQDIWTSLACSADGTKLFAAAGFGDDGYFVDGLIYASTNGGATWAPTRAPSDSWSSIACSADGTRLVAADSGNGDGLIYTSTDSGVAWSASYPPSSQLTAVATSADGTRSFAASTSAYGGIFYSGPLNVEVGATFTNVVVGYPVRLAAYTSREATWTLWSFGDGQTAANQTNVTHAWAAPGDYAVVLTAYGPRTPWGISATATVHVVQSSIHYVAAQSASPQPPYTSWATAASTIQDAVESFGTATPAGAVVLVTNGTYATGGRAVDGTTNRVVMDKPVHVLSVNGPQFTVIDGGRSIRCVYLGQAAVLSGFTLTNGSADNGGGVWCATTNAMVADCVIAGNSANNGGGAYGCSLVNCRLTGNAATWSGGGAIGGALNNCILTGNSADSGGAVAGAPYDIYLNNCLVASNSASYAGGGVFGGTLNNCIVASNSAEFGGGGYPEALNNCLIIGNRATESGGGVTGGVLNNCTVVGNSAGQTGGAAWDYATLNNCIIYFNRAPGVRANCDSSCALNYCCTTPMPLYGVGNITNAPLFVDLAGGNLRLQSNSPCINAGWNTLAVGSTDLDGRPRIGGSRVYRVDIGAYEYQGAGMGEFIGWLQHYGLPTDGSVDFTDPDGDHYNNWQEWLAGSDPTDALSAPPFITAQPVSQVVAAGSTATFSVTATPAGSGLRYQWRYNGTNDLPGATNSSLMLPNAQPASDGLYSVLVSNVFGSILSSNVTLRVDHVPVADASATRSPVISANGINATVILDGSRSTDADQDLLQYEWLSTLNSQLSTPLASGVVATSVLPVGAHPILLVVSDGFFASTNPVTVEVITTAQAVERLLALVEVRGLRVQPLRASLEVALASIQRRNAHSAINQLEAFQNKVRSQVAGQAAVLAATLLAAAQAIIDALAPPNEREPGQPDVRITSLERGNGRMRMHIMGIPRRPCIIQASTNLVDWEMIRVATEHAGGEFQFEDAGIRRSRYYRVVFP